MSPVRYCCLGVLIALAACERRSPPDPRITVGKVLEGMVVYPHSTPVSMNAGEDAGQLMLTSPDSMGVIASWFRQALALNGWQLTSDVTNPDGSVVMAAQKGQRPLWITLRPNTGAPGTTYTLIGAIPRAADSTPAVAPAAPATTPGQRSRRVM